MRRTLDEHLLENETNNKRGEKRYNIFLIVFLIGLIISTLIAWYEVKTIVVLGPIMSLIGIGFSIVAYKMNEKLSVFIGLIPLLLSVFWLFMIEQYDLSPPDCVSIVPLSLSIPTVFITAIEFNTWIKKRNEWK